MAARAKSKNARKAKPNKELAKRVLAKAETHIKRESRRRPRKVRPLSEIADDLGEDLSVREEAFVQAYISNNGQGVDAARTAGYSGDARTLAVQASRLLRRPNIMARLVAAKADIVQAHEATREEVLNNLRKWQIHAELDGNATAGLTATKMMGQTIGMFGSKVELSGPNGAPIQTDSTIGPRGLSDEMANDIRIKILGVHPRHMLEDVEPATADTAPKAPE